MLFSTRSNNRYVHLYFSFNGKQNLIRKICSFLSRKQHLCIATDGHEHYIHNNINIIKTWITRLHTALITRTYFLSLLHSISQIDWIFPKLMCLIEKRTRHSGKVMTPLEPTNHFIFWNTLYAINLWWLTYGKLGWPIKNLRNMERFINSMLRG